MLDYTNCNIDKVSVHHVGNKTNGEEILLSKKTLDISDSKLRELLFQYFLYPFPGNEFFSFTFTNQDFLLNALYNYSSDIFDNPKSFHKNSENIAMHLFEVSVHPQIKSGDLFITYFSNLSIDDKSSDAIGIFKSEKRQEFLKLEPRANDFSLKYDDGIGIDKLDKGCLIFNIEKEKGFKVCILDKSNKSAEAQFWKDNFLMIIPANDGYHNTREFLTIAKNYITKQFAEDFDISKTDQIDLLNRSVDYFKNHDSFEKDDFEKEVFYHPQTIKSFREFDEKYRAQNEMQISDNFEISSAAVKKQSRIFKSVLKLDKNFHIYIHGNKELIEQGIEKDGRKYYKIYYQQES